MAPRRTARWISAAALAAVGLAAPAVAQAPDAAGRPGAPGRAAIASADRRFLVSGMTSAENMLLARKLADEAAKVEAKTGMPLPLRRDQVLGVMERARPCRMPAC
jgi:hypothetical protein